MNPPNFDRVMVFKEPDLNKAAVEGYSARRGGRAMTDNPYPVASFRGSVWEDSWIIADSELGGSKPGDFEPASCSMPFAPGAIERHVRRKPLRHRLLFVAGAVVAAAAYGGLVGYLGAPPLLAFAFSIVWGVLATLEATK